VFLKFTVRSYVTCHLKYCTIDFYLNMCTTQRRKNKDGAKIITVNTMMQQRSTEQRSTVESRRRRTNFKMLVT